MNSAIAHIPAVPPARRRLRPVAGASLAKVLDMQTYSRKAKQDRSRRLEMLGAIRDECNRELDACVRRLQQTLFLMNELEKINESGK